MKKNKPNNFKGIVVAIKANFLIVEVDFRDLKKVGLDNYFSANSRFLCTRRSKLDFEGQYIDVGDRVCIESIDFTNKRAVISDVEPRNSFLKRPAVANVTLIAICISVDEPLFDFEQANRFLITAESVNIDPIIILTKVDLINNQLLNMYVQKLKLWGYDCFPVSIMNKQGIDLISERFKKTRLTVLAGPSGVGKTTLINHLIPTLSLPTSAVSKKLKRGINTTRHVELFTIGNGSLLADTPGFNRPDIDSDQYVFANLFPELRAQLINSKCKFRNCLHRDEPGCAINKGFERYSFYREYIDEIINSRPPYQGG